MKKMVFLAALCAVVLPLAAQNTVSGKTDFFTGMLIAEGVNGGNPFWSSSGMAKIQLDSSIKDAVKASIGAKYTIKSAPGVAGTITAVQGVVLERAFIKVRLPWFTDDFMRLSAGKMPLSWGYGLYFNAGDIIFGAAPSTLISFDTADFRIETAWMVTLQMPITDWLFAEIIAVPPLSFIPQTGIVTIAGPVNEKGAFGGRLVFQPLWYALQGFETGYLAADNASKHRVYAAMDGTIGADYNLCASLEIDSAKPFRDYAKTLSLSAALFYTFTISGDVRDYPLTVRAESLYYPLGEKITSFAMISFGFTDTLSASVMYLNSVEKDLYSAAPMGHNLSASIVWIPIKRLKLVLQGVVSPAKPQTFSSITAGCVYNF